MQNILALTGEAFGKDAVTRLSTTLHESPKATQRGVEAALPASLVGLSSFASSVPQAAELLDVLHKGDYPHIEPSSFTRTVRDETETSRLAESGQNFLRQIFGNKLGQVIAALASQAGLSRASASTLLGLSAPLVLEAVGKEATTQGLDARSLSLFLGDESRKVSGLLPVSLTHALSVGTAAGKDARGPVRIGGTTTRRSAQLHDGTHLPELKPSSNPMWVLIPLALLTVFGLWWFHRMYVQRPIDVESLQDERPVHSPGDLKPRMEHPSQGR